jgi:hypothetical protein
MTFKTKNEVVSCKETWRDFKGVNNINLFESDSEDEDPFKSQETIDEKYNIFSILPQAIEDRGIKCNEGILLGFKTRVYKPSLGDLIHDIER